MNVAKRQMTEVGFLESEKRDFVCDLDFFADCAMELDAMLSLRKKRFNRQYF